MTRIYQLARECEWWTWLCPAHLAPWLAKGWQIRGQREPPHPLPCDDCGEERGT